MTREMRRDALISMRTRPVKRLDIMCKILSLCRSPTQVTNILHECSLDHRHLSKYLNYLDHNILLECFSEDRVYRTTKKGRRFIEEYKRARKALKLDQRVQTTKSRR